MRYNVVRDTLVAEIRELMPKSKHYQEQLANAKTRTKKNLMKRRLKQNNIKLSELLVTLDRLEKVHGESNVPQTNEEGRTETKSEPEESTDEST